MKKIVYLILCISTLGFVASSCSDDDEVGLPKIAINFATDKVGIATDETSGNITLSLSRVAASDVDVALTVQFTDVTYGNQFTTVPEIANNKATVTIPAGSTSASISISKIAGALFGAGTEAVTFTIASASGLNINEFVIGSKKESTLSFASIVSQGSQLTLEGKTAESSYANAVYVDFSSNMQLTSNRKNWALGFYCGADDFRVVLNTGYSVTATTSGKTDIAAVTVDDANNALDLGATAMSDIPLSPEVVDGFDGLLSNTVFASVSATSSSNMVYFVATEDNRANRNEWYRVKVDRTSTGYAVQYAKVNETTIKTVTIDKDADYNLKHLSLTSGEVVNAEPKKTKWDIAWGYNVGSNNGMPYFMQDFVLINNLGGTKVAQVMTELVSYNDFKMSNLSSITLLTDRNVIGANWRTVSMNASGGVATDRFYVIQDPNGNYYKMRFLKMGVNNDGAERGRPVIEYAIIK